ncbi:hypothetical protein D9757_007070 [Collybiopsis confluens]|uniref:heme oxygenase (biliverdin-producing) n=1 Tax=Collybiopsis confluens TaxID=2823264 RepID=A0A8H5M4R4_9AGAR|nr:hypothetical protein D9757_007070 [Collybiopsis confluens]
MSSTTDLSQSLSDILRQSTKEAHDKIEHSSAAAKLVNGELLKVGTFTSSLLATESDVGVQEEYVRFLMMLWHVYTALEDGLEEHATNPVIEPIYNPTLLRRGPALSADISYLLQVPESTWHSHSIHTTLVSSPPKGMSTYVDRIREISSSSDPAQLVAHAYVRYLGDLSGGQNIRHALAKAYGLDEASGEGLSFYAFKELSSSKPASLGEMRRIKDWFRNGMNQGAGDNAEVKDAIAQEASDVFHYNGALFNAILEKPIGQKNPSAFPAGSGRHSILSVITSVTLTALTAVSLAHFYMVVSGRYGRLGPAEQWLKWNRYFRFNIDLMAFLSKLLGRKKQEGKPSPNSEASPSPLQEKFEYVIPSPGPAAKAPDHPHLSLNFPDRRESPALDNVFGNDNLMPKTRLSPEQALLIVRTSSQAIIARGLETLGIMHPNWHSASPVIQTRLILLFIQSSAAVFESEITSTRSPHDVSAVLRWAFRHLQIPGASFGNDPSWYSHFLESEKSASYPQKSFSEILAPQLPAINLELLTTTLDLFTSLAAHAEANSVSGSKLSKFLGFWLLSAERSSPNGFLSFYDRWDRQGRMLEHLFLSYIRQVSFSLAPGNEIANHRMPKRLVELVKHYPYHYSIPSSDSDLLPRPRFSTRCYDALFVHIVTEVPAPNVKASRVSLQMVVDALNATCTIADTPTHSVWRKIQEIGTSGDEEPYSPGKYPGLGRILSEETLLLARTETSAEPSINFLSNDDDGQYGPNIRGSSHPRQLSASSFDKSTLQQSNPIGLDWNTFSTSGFLQSTPLATPLAETLLESRDTEVTSSSVTPFRKGSKKFSKTLNQPSRRSLDALPPIIIPPSGSHIQITNGSKPSSRVSKVELIPVDEAFIDFWNDSLFDPITDAESWPKFVICRLKANVVPEVEGTQGKKVDWMIIEQEYAKPAPPTTVPASQSPQSNPETAVESSAADSAPSPRLRTRASSPRPSLSSVNASVKRFSFWGGSKREKGDKEQGHSPTKKGKAKANTIGEMGEILTEEESSIKTDSSPLKKSVDIPAVVKEVNEDEGAHIKNDEAIRGGASLTTDSATGIFGIALVASQIPPQSSIKKEEEVVVHKTDTFGASPEECKLLKPAEKAQSDDTESEPTVESVLTPEASVVLTGGQEEKDLTSARATEKDAARTPISTEEIKGEAALKPTETAEDVPGVSPDPPPVPVSNPVTELKIPRDGQAGKTDPFVQMVDTPAEKEEKHARADVAQIETNPIETVEAKNEETFAVKEDIKITASAVEVAEAPPIGETGPASFNVVSSAISASTEHTESGSTVSEPKIEQQDVTEADKSQAIQEIPAGDPIGQSSATVTEPIATLSKNTGSPNISIVNDGEGATDGKEPLVQELTDRALAVIDARDVRAKAAGRVSEVADPVTEEPVSAVFAEGVEQTSEESGKVESVTAETNVPTEDLGEELVAEVVDESPMHQLMVVPATSVAEQDAGTEASLPPRQDSAIAEPAAKTLESEESLAQPAEPIVEESQDEHFSHEATSAFIGEHGVEPETAEHDRPAAEEATRIVIADDFKPAQPTVNDLVAPVSDSATETLLEPPKEELIEHTKVDHEEIPALGMIEQEVEQGASINSEPSGSLVSDSTSSFLPEIPIVDGPTPSNAPLTIRLDEPVNESMNSRIPAAVDIPDDHLPPAPKTVVLSGETPGPQLALSLSEAVTAATVAALSEASNGYSATTTYAPEDVEIEKEGVMDVVQSDDTSGSEVGVTSKGHGSQSRSLILMKVISKPTEDVGPVFDYPSNTSA